jgi:hypothetical protein
MLSANVDSTRIDPSQKWRLLPRPVWNEKMTLARKKIKKTSIKSRNIAPLSLSDWPCKIVELRLMWFPLQQHWLSRLWKHSQVTIWTLIQKSHPHFSSYDRIQTGQDLHWQLQDPRRWPFQWTPIPSQFWFALTSLRPHRSRYTLPRSGYFRPVPSKFCNKNVCQVSQDTPIEP